jgi:diamine N-acetyltransferase
MATITLREVTADTLHAISIAQAYVYREILWLRGIYADETAVGFVMLADDTEAQEYVLARLMIDERFQGQGYGVQALQQVIEYVKTRPGAKELQVSVVPGEGSPGPFYERLGFVYNGAYHGNEPVLRLELTAVANPPD